MRMGKRILELMVADNKRTWRLFGLILSALAIEVLMVFYALFDNIFPYDLWEFAFEYSIGGALLITALVCFCGWLRVASWVKNSQRQHAGLFNRSDLLVLLLSPELPQHMDVGLEYTRPPGMLRGKRERNSPEATLVNRMQHYIRHFEAYESAFELSRSANPEQAQRSRLNLTPLVLGICVLLSLGATVAFGVWAMLCLPLLYIALIWNTCRIEAGRIGLRQTLLVALEPTEPSSVVTHASLERSAALDSFLASYDGRRQKTAVRR
jgi:hypothetical protein